MKHAQNWSPHSSFSSDTSLGFYYECRSSDVGMSINGCSTQPDSWRELWDRADAVSTHTSKGIEFLERIGTYAKERAQIEDDYAKSLKNLAKKSFGKKKEDEEAVKSFTYARAFADLLREIESVAAQHEMIAEKLRTDVVIQTASKGNQHRVNRKQCLLDLQTINANLNAALDHLNKQHRNYGKSFKEAEAAFGKYYKAEKNMEISRLDLEKAKSNAHTRAQLSEDAKASYAHALQSANDAQAHHYGNYLPETLDKLRAVDMERIADTKRAMEMCIKAEVDVHPIIARCHDDMRRALEQMDAMHDSATVVEQNKTGYGLPSPIDFEDLGNPDRAGSGPIVGSDSVDSTLKRGVLSGMRKESKVSRNPSMKIFGGSGPKHKTDANSDYGQLPPHQRIKKIEEKIASLSADREKANKEKEGCIKLQQAYRNNPKLGNAADCDQLLAKHNKEIDTLTAQINKLRTLMEEVHSHNNLPLGSIIDTPPSVRSGSSASSIPKPTNGRSSVSEESITSIDNSKSENRRPDHREDLPVYSNCDLPILGTAMAQFAYDGGTEEKDEGDGWTRVRTLNGDAEGFVPSTYLKCSWYPIQ